MSADSGRFLLACFSKGAGVNVTRGMDCYEIGGAGSTMTQPSTSWASVGSRAGRCWHAGA